MSDMGVTDRVTYALAGCRNREDAARLYAVALGGEADFGVLNRLIEARWSKSGLSWIKQRAWRIGICEFCFETTDDDPLPSSWDFVCQSAVCPSCRERVKADGGYSVVLAGAYAGDRPDPRDKELAPAVDEVNRILSEPSSHD